MLAHKVKEAVEEMAETGDEAHLRYRQSLVLVVSSHKLHGLVHTVFKQRP